MEEDDALPDSVFIEDTAVLTDKVAIVTRPFPESRIGETDAVSDVLQNLFSHVEYIEEPGTLEGGDVLQIGNRFFIGISERTNKEGANQLIGILESFGYRGFKVPLRQLLHLKTGVSYLGEDTILIGKELIQEKRFNPYKKIRVEGSESYAANCIRVNDYILVPKGYPNTFQTLTEAGFNLKEVDMSEFRKLDGGLSCLSLRF
jgi:dimethylargininase